MQTVEHKKRRNKWHILKVLLESAFLFCSLFCHGANEGAVDLLWQEAIELKKSGKDFDAAEAFMSYSIRGTNQVRKIEAVLKAAESYDQAGQSRKAERLYERIIRDDMAKRKAPHIYDEAYNFMHEYLLGKSEKTVTRSRLVNEAVRSVGDSKIRSKILEREAEVLLSEGKTRKALELYCGASQLSEIGTNIVSLLQKGSFAYKEKVEWKDVLLYRKVCVAKPVLAKEICKALSACKGGWCIENAYAEMQFEQGKYNNAIDVWEGLLKQRRGKVDEISASRALAILAQDRKKGICEIEKWLIANGTSKRRDEMEVRLLHQYAENGDYAIATNAMNSFLAKNPQSPYCAEVSTILEKTIEKIKETEHREKVLGEQKKKEKEDPVGARLVKAERLLQGGKLDEALKEYQRLPRRKGSVYYGRIAYGMGAVYHAKGEEKEAIQIWNQLWQNRVAETNRNYVAKAGRGIADIMLEERMEAGKAAKMYSEVLEVDVGIADKMLWINYALSLIIIGLPKEAQEIFAKEEEKAKRQGDKEGEIYWRDLTMRLERGNWEASEGQVSAQVRKARYLMTLADGQLSEFPKKALKNYQLVFQSSAKELHGKAALGMANAYLLLNDKRNAFKMFDLFKVMPLSASPLARWALLEAGTFSASPIVGDSKQARKYFAQVSTSYPGTKEAMVCEFYMATLAWRERKWSEAEKLHKTFISAWPDTELAVLAREERLPAIAKRSMATPVNHKTLNVTIGSSFKKRRAVVIDQTDDRATDATLNIHAESGCKIVESHISEQCDGRHVLWTKGSESEDLHTYYMSDAYSSQEYVFIEGKVEKTQSGKGRGKGSNELPFDVTVPAVDIDWEGYENWQDEAEEETRFVPILVSGNEVQCRNVKIMKPQDQVSYMRIYWSPRDVILTAREGFPMQNGMRIIENSLDLWPICAKVSFTGTLTEPIEIRVEGYRDDDSLCAIDRVRGVGILVDFVTPNNDPTSSPCSFGIGQNEFTYSADSPGVFQMNLAADIFPQTSVKKIIEKLRFEVEDIQGSKKNWGNSTPNGKPVNRNGKLQAAVRFSGLPRMNHSFGRKTAKIIYDDRIVLDKNDYEVFYPKNGKNHPMCSSCTNCPNWFYYWKQALGCSNVSYYWDENELGNVMAITFWNYHDFIDKNSICISHLASERYEFNEMDGKIISLTGIDLFKSVLLHESTHLQQIRKADGLLQMDTNSPWRFGWSWNQGESHNHWSVGGDNKPGILDVDDDNNGIIDDLISTDPGELGSGDDVCLENSLYEDWPSSWILPSRPWFINVHDPIEQEAYKAGNRDIESENTFFDWGNPGKQHQTIDKYDD